MEYPIELNVQYTENQSRLSVLLRMFLIIPHYFILYFLSIAASVVLLIAWFAILFTGKYPKSLYDFVLYFWKWWVRFEGYSLLITDKYPPFSGEHSTLPKPPEIKQA
jgi:hypothetical protein